MNKLEERFLDTIEEHYDNGNGYDIDKIATACASITKEEMKSFAEWILKANVGWEFNWFRMEDGKQIFYSTEELIELYLNQNK